MESVHLPRTFAVFLLLLVLAAFLSGTMLAFSGVQAAQDAVPTATLAEEAPQPTPTPGQEARPSEDTSGILVLGILLVVIILIGLFWGGRRGSR